MNAQDDKKVISHIYEESWKHAYKGILPQTFLDQIPEGHWCGVLETFAKEGFIMLEGDKIIGTASYGPSRDENLKDYGEIISIYLLPQYIGKGYGKKLFQAVMDQLKKEGYNKVYLWVLEENKVARAFYERFGFKTNGAYLDDQVGGKAVKEIQYIVKLLKLE